MIWNSKYALLCSIRTGDPPAHSCLPMLAGFPGLSLNCLCTIATQLPPITPACHDTEHPLPLPFRRNAALPLTYSFSVPTVNLLIVMDRSKLRPAAWVVLGIQIFKIFFPFMHFSFFLVLYAHCLLFFPSLTISISRHLCESHNHISLKTLQELI